MPFLLTELNKMCNIPGKEEKERQGKARQEIFKGRISAIIKAAKLPFIRKKIVKSHVNLAHLQ